MSEHVLQQALYGYQDGHRLLASSVQLAPADRRFLARQTDSGEVGVVPGWDELLAGFVLPSGTFAWAMTWPAPEIPRPGCVWTHVLILDADIIIGAADRDRLLAFFRRPSEPSFAEYSSQIRWDRSELRRPPPNAASVADDARSWLASVCWAVFEPPARAVRIARMDVAAFGRHQLLFAPWQISWPELRANFAAAEAPITAKTLPHRTFDLLLQRSVSRTQSKLGDPSRVLDGIPNASPPSWAEALATEVESPSGLSEFLSHYGPDCPPERESMRPLVQCWLALRLPNEREAATCVVDLLARLLPDRAAGRRTKAALLRPISIPVGCAQELDDVAILAALAASPIVGAFNLRDLGIRARARLAVEREPHSAGLLLEAAITAVDRPLANAIIDGVIDAVRLCPLSISALVDIQMLEQVVRHRPELVALPGVWTTLGGRRAWDEASRIRGKARRVETVTELVRIGAYIDPAMVIDSWGDLLTPIATQLAHDRVDVEAITPWTELMTMEQRRSFAAESRQGSAVQAAIASSAPAEVQTWHIDVVSRALVNPTRPKVAAVVFVAALSRDRDPAWAPLAVESYARVYRAAIEDGLGEARGDLAKLSRSSLPEWDVAARSARALNAAFKSGDWAATATLECKDKDAFTALVNADDHAWLARRIVATAVSHPGRIVAWQRRVLDAALAARVGRDPRGTIADAIGGAASEAWKAAKRRK